MKGESRPIKPTDRNIYDITSKHIAVCPKRIHEGRQSCNTRNS